MSVKARRVPNVRNKIVEAVERQLVSDVPVGLLLSSGIDSMSILASIKLLNKFHNFFKFDSLDSSNLISFLNTKKYFIGIQGGTGILRDNIINQFEFGILNFHPGDLPFYRGCSAPEWQLFENKQIVSTCHLIDKGIDSGPILRKKTLDVDMKSYEAFRASVYPQTAIFVCEIIHDLINGKQEMNYITQDESIAIYRKYIGDNTIAKLKNSYF